MIKKGDSVKILKGGNRGEKGKVLKVFPKLGLVVVEGVNMKHKSQKSRKRGEKGQILKIAMPINISNVAKAE